MIKIRLTLKDGRKFYVTEDWPYTDKQILLKYNFSEGLSYHTILEFQCAWKIFHNPHHYEFKGVKIENPDYNWKMSSYLKFKHVNPEDVTLFEAIDCHSLEVKEFDVNQYYTLPKKILRFPPDQFHMLKQCRYASCHWTYIGKKWVAFPKAEDWQKINRIEYYRRGLTAFIFDAFIHRNVRYDLMDGFYSNKRELSFNPIMQKMYLRDDIDSCARFTVLEIKEKKK